MVFLKLNDFKLERYFAKYEFTAPYLLCIETLKKIIRRNTRAIVINSPHNPTGCLISGEKLASIVELARSRDILLFSDEVYRFLEYDQSDRRPAACDIYENAVSLGVMSKAFGLAGLRIGWGRHKEFRNI